MNKTMKEIVKIFITYAVFLSVLFITYFAFNATGMAQTSADNEIFLNQSGDTITLNIDQIGYGNKIGGSVVSSTVATDWLLTGSSLTIDIDQIGNNNQILGSTIFSSSTVDILNTGDSNIITWDIGDIGSSDSSALFLDFTGDTNLFTFNQGSVASAERLDLDVLVIGSTNTFDFDVESDDATINLDLTGDTNNFVVNQRDAGYHSVTLDYTGDGGDIDINQWSGSGLTSAYGVINGTIVSDNATIQINQVDAVE